VDVGGVGYALQIPLSTYYQLTGRSNGTVSLHVYTHVREDALALFGFATTSERATFERLLRITGVGPRIALGVLSGIGAEELERAVLDGDRDRLQRIPGIGRKTAERILLELRDRLEREDREGRRPRGGAASRAVADGSEQTRVDAVSALQNLGYARHEAGEAVDRALVEAGVEPPPTLERVLKSALRSLVQG
jgi:Holliday junction DNA helicase RuvA